jgi:hypothetical protein
MEISKPKRYRAVIDDLVRICHFGQGQIGPDWIRSGDWLSHLAQEDSPLDHAMSQLVSRLDQNERETLAQVFAREFSGGVFNALVCLEEFEVVPFESGYEGSSFNDFIGRMAGDWDWPED